MWEFWNIILRYDLNKIINERDCKKRQRINELHEKRLNLFRKLLEPLSYPFTLKIGNRIVLRDAINKIDAEIAQLEKEIAEDRYNQSKGESKMDNREELKRSLAEEKQRVKDSLANVEKMEKQLEGLNKKDNPKISATGVILNKNIINSYFASILGDNSVKNRKNYNTSLEDEIFNINNMFISYEQAEQEALRRKIQELIRRRAMEWNSNHDWRKDNKERYEILYNFDKDKINLAVLNDYCSYGNIVFENKELAQKMIDELNNNFNKNELKVGFGVI